MRITLHEYDGGLYEAGPLRIPLNDFWYRGDGPRLHRSAILGRMKLFINKTGVLL